MDTYICKKQMVSTKIAFIKAKEEDIYLYKKEIILEFLKLNNLSLRRPHLIDKYIKEADCLAEVFIPLNGNRTISFIPVGDGISIYEHTEKITLTKTNK